jgi:hypothetical protein
LTPREDAAEAPQIAAALERRPARGRPARKGRQHVDDGDRHRLAFAWFVILDDGQLLIYSSAETRPESQEAPLHGDDIATCGRHLVLDAARLSSASRTGQSLIERSQ